MVVTYNSEEVIGNCLRACLALPRPNSILVVDNASADRTVERARALGVRVEANNRNRGFAGAVNQGISALPDAAILILNPDAVPQRGIARMESAVLMEHIGAVGGTLVGLDGLPQEGFQVRSFPTPWTLVFEMLGLNRLFPANPVNRSYRFGKPEQPAGAFLMIRRSAWKEIGGFDERFYPVWFEDVDFCKRLHDAGWGIGFLPDAVASHSGGHSVKALEWAARQRFWYGSLLRYALKHFDLGPRVLVSLTLTFACIPRAVVGILETRSWQPLSVYIDLVGQAFRNMRMTPTKK